MPLIPISIKGLKMAKRKSSQSSKGKHVKTRLRKVPGSSLPSKELEAYSHKAVE